MTAIPERRFCLFDFIELGCVNERKSVVYNVMK